MARDVFIVLTPSNPPQVHGVFPADERGETLSERVFQREAPAVRVRAAIEDGRALLVREREVLLAIKLASTPTAAEAELIPSLVAARLVEIVPIANGVGFAVTALGLALLDD